MGLRIALYHNLSSGGAKRTIYDLVRRLESDHQIDLYCPSTANLTYCDTSAYTSAAFVFPFRPAPTIGSPFGRANPAIRLWNLWRLQAVERQIAAEIDRRGYDVAFVEPCMISQAPSLLRYLRTPTVYFCHEPPRGIYEPQIPRPYRGISRRRQALDKLDFVAASYSTALRLTDLANVRRATNVLVTSHYMSDRVIEIYGVIPRVNHPGVDSTIFRPSAIARDNLVVSTGALKPEKGFDFVIQGVATIPQSRRPSVVIVSNWEIPDERRYLASLADRSDVRVTFRVDVSDTELVSLYNRALATAYAPVREPLGLVPLESQSCTTPVVGVAEGGVAETIINQETGLLTERDPSAFGQALQRLLVDDTLRAEYGRQGRSHVERNWNWEVSTAELVQALEAAANSPSAEKLGAA